MNDSFAELMLKGLVLGIGAAAPIGPVNVEIARRTLRGGFPAGFAVGCGAVTVDVALAILTAVGLGPLVAQPVFYWPLAVGGVALLSYLGVMSLRAAARPPTESAASSVVIARRGYWAGLLMTALNPMTLGFWFVAVPALVGAIAAKPARDLPIICLGVFAGTMGWVIFFVGVMSQLRRLGAGLVRAADLLGGAVLLGFALALLRSAVASL